MSKYCIVTDKIVDTMNAKLVKADFYCYSCDCDETSGEMIELDFSAHNMEGCTSHKIYLCKDCAKSLNDKLNLIDF